MRSLISIQALCLIGCSQSQAILDAGASGATAGGLAPTSCTIGGLDYPPGAANPADGCQLCEPQISTIAWASMSCPAYQVCFAGACVSASNTGCTIPDAGEYSAGATNPSNPCQSCVPGSSTTTWTDAADGAACATGKSCQSGSCQFPGCTIDGGTYPDGGANPVDPCQSCQPASSATSWTNVADGTSCGPDSFCTQGACQPGCWLDGGFVPSGGLQTGNPCQVCLPSTSTDAWLAVTGFPPDGGCAQGQVCNDGACAAGCFIDGGFRHPGTGDPLHSCRSCEPATSVQVWINGFTKWAEPDTAPEIVVVTDVNGDGKPDLVTGNNFANPLLNKGDGTFFEDVPAPLSAVPSGGAVVPAAFPNVFFTTGGDTVDYAMSATTPFATCVVTGTTVPCALELSASNAQAVAVASGDFDGSGFPGLAVADLANLSVEYFTSTGLVKDASATLSLGIPAASALMLASGDFNGDGLDDLAVGYQSGSGHPVETVQIWLSQSDGGFTNTGNAFSGPGSSGQLAAADFNRDGNLDLALANGSSQIQVAFGQGTGQFSTPVGYPIGSGSTTVVAGDFNADGWPDLAVTNATDQTVAILYNQGDGTFTPQLVVYTFPGIPNSLSASGWSAPLAGSSYGSPTTVLGATDDAGIVLGLVNVCK